MTDGPRNTSEPYLAAGQGDTWAAEAAARGQVGTQRLLNASVVDATEEVRTALGLGAGEQVVVRRRLILADEQPVEIATSFYPASFAESTPLARPEKIKGGAVAVLAGLRRAPTDVVEAVTARWPTADEASTLQADDHEPLLVLSRTNLDQTGTPVEFAVNVSVARLDAPHVYRLKVSAA